MRLLCRFVSRYAALIALIAASSAIAQSAAPNKVPSKARTEKFRNREFGATRHATPRDVEFPAELVKWKPWSGNPVFTAEGAGHWDVKIRERGWILRDDDGYKLWFTGYDGTRDGRKKLGLATSRDGVHWKRFPKNPIYRDHWVEDMTVVRRGGNYYMFAEGEKDNHSVMLTSKDGIDWKWHGELDVRAVDGKRSVQRPCGTPTVWVEDSTWKMLYEVNDDGIWLAKSKDPLSLIWTNARDEPVLKPGPDPYDREKIAANQVIKYRGVYYAFYHGSGSSAANPRTWTTNIARSTDLLHWKKHSRNPIVNGDRSSGIVVPVNGTFRLYTMHDQIDLFESESSGRE